MRTLQRFPPYHLRHIAAFLLVRLPRWDTGERARIPRFMFRPFTHKQWQRQRAESREQSEECGMAPAATAYRRPHNTYHVYEKDHFQNLSPSIYQLIYCRRANKQYRGYRSNVPRGSVEWRFPRRPLSPSILIFIYLGDVFMPGENG